MTSPHSPAAAFSLDLEAAVALREASYARQLDEELIAGGGRIAYAVDSAILNFLFLGGQKWRREASGVSGESDRYPEGYQIFRGPRRIPDAESAPVAEAPATKAEPMTPLASAQARLKRMLLWYLLEEGGSSREEGFEKLILLPGHVLEVRNLYDGIVSQFEKQPGRLSSLKAQAMVIAELAQNAEGPAASAKDERDALMEALSGIAASIGDPHEKFDRINALIQRRQIISLRAAAADPSFDWDEFKLGTEHIFKVESDVVRDEDDGSEGSWSWWNSELHGRLPPRFAPLDRDALSTLDRINRRLDPTKTRVILFTDNQAIIDAGHGYFPFKNGDPALRHLSFSDLFLRHPRSLLLDPKFMRPSAEPGLRERFSTSEADAWLGALLDETMAPLPAEGEPHEPDAAESSQMALDRWRLFRAGLNELRARITDLRHLNRVLQRTPTLHERFTDRWAEYLHSLHYQYQLNSPATSDRLAEIVKEYDPNIAEDVESFLGAVKDHLNFLTEKSWTTFFNTVADTGLELISWRSLNAQPPVWPVPVLFIQADELLSDAVKSFWKPSALRRQPGEVLRALNGPEFQATLERSYIYALCYGLLFAHAERWPMTRLLARRALRISRQLKIEHGTPYLAAEDSVNAAGNVRVSGREASYLLAVSSRVNGMNSGDFASARQALQVSIDTTNDFADDTGVGTKITGVRFEAESIAIAFAEMALQAGRPDDAAVRDLRFRAMTALDRTDSCEEEIIRTHAAIALRSEYFFSLQFSIPSSERQNVDATLVDGLAELIEAQIADIEFIYGSGKRSGLELAPLRDRALLRLASTFANDPSLLPDWMLTTTLLQEREDPVSGMRPIDRRQLAAIERQVARLQKVTSGERAVG